MFTIKDLIRLEISPALGCTEPVCVALACSHAGSMLAKREIVYIKVLVSEGLYKNGMGVYLPGARGEKGLYMAAALGSVCGEPKDDLEVFSKVNDDYIKMARELVASGRVIVDVAPNKKGIYVFAKIKGISNIAEAEISGFHNRLTSLKLDGKLVFERDAGGGEIGDSEIQELSNWLKNISSVELFDLLDGLDEYDLDFLKKGVNMNLELAQQGLNEKWGYGTSHVFLKTDKGIFWDDNLSFKAQKYVLAAVDARMGGASLPAMSSAGSGNNGIIATLPVWVIYSGLKLDEGDFLKAIGLSHVITSKLKAHIGRLTPICSCSLCAGGGAAGAISWLLSKDREIALSAVKNHLVSMYGVLCDGAKPACSIKLFVATSCALNSAYFAINHINISREDGICGASLDETLDFVEELTANSYKNMDKNILNILRRK